MGAVEELIKNNPIYKKEQSTRMDMEGRVPNEPWSEEEKLIAKRLLYAGPKPYIPARIKGAGVNATRLQAIPEDWSKMRSSQILTQASKEMKELGIGWWDTVDNDKELQATVDYIRNAGKDNDDDDDESDTPEPLPDYKEPNEHTEQLAEDLLTNDNDNEDSKYEEVYSNKFDDATRENYNRLASGKKRTDPYAAERASDYLDDYRIKLIDNMDFNKKKEDN